MTTPPIGGTTTPRTETWNSPDLSFVRSCRVSDPKSVGGVLPKMPPMPDASIAQNITSLWFELCPGWAASS